MALKVRAARYYDDRQRNLFSVVLYHWDIDPEECPHDWYIALLPRDWRRLIGSNRLPPAEGHVEVVLTAEIV